MHMIFDIKMVGNFTRKARLVAEGHTIAPPSSNTYSSVVYRESVGVAFLLASLNDLDIFACDIGNAYLNVNVGRNFGHNQAHSLVLKKEC